jgi:hypothetical protein
MPLASLVRPARATGAGGRGLEVCQWPDRLASLARQWPPPAAAPPGGPPPPPAGRPKSCQCHPSESAASLPVSTRCPGSESESTTKLRGSQLDAATGSGCQCRCHCVAAARPAGPTTLGLSGCLRVPARARGPIFNEGPATRGSALGAWPAGITVSDRLYAKGPNLKPPGPRKWRAAGGRDAAQCARLQLEQPQATTSSPQAQAGGQRGRRAWEVKVPARSENASV